MPPLISSPPIDSRLHLGEHRSLRYGGEGPGWPAGVASVIGHHVGMCGQGVDLSVVKERRGEGFVAKL